MTSADKPGDTPQEIRREDYRPPAWAILHADLEFDLEPAATRVDSTLEIERAPDAAPGTALVLDGEDLDLIEIAMDGRGLDAGEFDVGPAGLTIHDPPARFRLRTVTRIDPAANSRLEGLYVSSGNYCTQCEAEGFRRITWYLDRPDVMATFRVAIRGNASRLPVMLSNGNLIAERELPDGRREAVWHDPFPKPSYLFALVAGDLSCVEDTFTTRSGRAVKLRIFVEHGNEGRTGYAMDSLKRAMRWDEDVYGLEYDLDLFNIVAVSDFNMGAMENKSLNVFNAKYVLADPETATDSDYAFIETIVAHEYFHNWTGNRVTCRDWFQLSLKEGLTVFRDQQFSADMRSAPVKRIQDVRTLRARQFPEDAGPLAHPVRPDSYIEINNFYTPTVYEKGAEVIRMMHALLGPERFRAGIDVYFERHDGQAVTCDDFVAAMQDASGVDLSRFRRWYSQAGTPVVRASGEWDADAGRYTLCLAQETPPTPGQPEKGAVVIPLALGLVGADGRDLPATANGRSPERGMLVLDEAERTIVFDGVRERPVPSLNRGFSAPIRLEVDLSDADRAHLMARDPDPFNRWEAGYAFATSTLLDMVQAMRASGTAEPASAFVEAYGVNLADEAVDPAFKAQLLTLPGEDWIAERMDEVDVEAIHAARNGLRDHLARKWPDRWHTLFEAARPNAPYSPDGDQAGWRSLSGVALAALARVGPEGTEVARQRYHVADNMTDRMAALSVLNERAGAARDEALEEFRQRFADDAHVLDKWFGLHATAPLPDAVERVERLMGDPAFSMRNPNKVRALIGAFAQANPIGFHRADGAGYRFFADRVLELDAINPQTAARVLVPLGRWRRFDAGRQALMRTELERILASPGVSKDVYEIASRALA